MSHLLDTNVVSELRKSARRADPNVRAWAQRQPTSELSISVVTVMEIEIGIARLERRDSAQGQVLRTWLGRDLLAAFATRTLPVDLDVVRRAASMHVPDPRSERGVLIAATALTHNLVVVTRNIPDSSHSASSSSTPGKTRDANPDHWRVSNRPERPGRIRRSRVTVHLRRARRASRARFRPRFVDRDEHRLDIRLPGRPDEGVGPLIMPSYTTSARRMTASRRCGDSLSSGTSWAVTDDRGALGRGIPAA